MTGLILSIVLAATAVLGTLLWWRRHEATNREAFEALAAQRGWSLNISKQSLGRPAVLRLSARSGTHWTAESCKLAAAGATSASAIPTTEFRSPEPAWPEGLLLIGPALPQDLEALAEQLRGEQDSRPGRRLIGQLAGVDMTETGATLRPLPAPEGLTVLASIDPGHSIDIKAIARLIADWPPAHASDKGHPIVIFGPDGLRLRLRHGTSTATQMERFIDLALKISRVLERR